MDIQRSEAWFQSRLGRVTASRVADVIAKTKSGYSASRDNYMAQLICERLTGQQGESFTNAAMTWGTETEPLARSAFEAHADVMVEEVGFVPHPTIEILVRVLTGWWGCLECWKSNVPTPPPTLTRC